MREYVEVEQATSPTWAPTDTHEKAHRLLARVRFPGRRGHREGEPRPSLRMRASYLFDASLSYGTAALIGWLAVVSAVVVVVAAVVVAVLDTGPAAGSVGFLEGLWMALMRTLDPGTMGQDSGWGFRVVMLGVTLGGIFVVSSLIGVLTTGMNARITELRKGRSQVLVSGHTLIVGWSKKVFTLLAELAEANRNVPRARVVILADHDKVMMEDEIRARVGAKLGKMKVICRSGDPLVPDDLAIANARNAKAVVMLAPDDDTQDSFALKVLLALTKGEPGSLKTSRIVGTIQDDRTLEAGRIIADANVPLINVDELFARVMAQTCRQSGLSLVYTELLNFDGDEIYFHSALALAGITYGDALLYLGDSSLIGIRHASGGSRSIPRWTWCSRKMTT